MPGGLSVLETVKTPVIRVATGCLAGYRCLPPSGRQPSSVSVMPGGLSVSLRPPLVGCCADPASPAQGAALSRPDLAAPHRAPLNFSRAPRVTRRAYHDVPARHAPPASGTPLPLQAS